MSIFNFLKRNKPITTTETFAKKETLYTVSLYIYYKIDAGADKYHSLTRGECNYEQAKKFRSEYETEIENLLIQLNDPNTNFITTSDKSIILKKESFEVALINVYKEDEKAN